MGVRAYNTSEGGRPRLSESLAMTKPPEHGCSGGFVLHCLMTGGSISRYFFRLALIFLPSISFGVSWSS